ncbi:MAG: AMP-binding protein, partial [Cycloclasticus sp.]
MNLSQCVNRAVQQQPNGIATIFAGREHTWTTFKERISCLAGGLKQLGTVDNDRIAILALNSDRYLEYFFAVPWAGGMVVPINVRLAAPEIVFTLNDSESTVLIVDDAFAAVLPALEGKLDTVKTIIFAGEGETPKGCVNYEELITNNSPTVDAGRCDKDLAGLFYTGGTTGRSKGVM